MGIIIAALIWGFAEATLFFIVPDVLITFVALRRGVRPALKAAAAAIVGAVAGGALMFLWGRYDTATAWGALDLVPGISPDMMSWVQIALMEQGVLALFLGAISGIPYKIFAVLAGTNEFNFAGFLAVSLVARGARFIAVIGLVEGLRRFLSSWLSERSMTIALALFWIAFYIFYFTVVPR